MEYVSSSAAVRESYRYRSLVTRLRGYTPTYPPISFENTFEERSLILVTFQTFDRSDEATVFFQTVFSKLIEQMLGQLGFSNRRASMFLHTFSVYVCPKSATIMSA